MVVPNLFFQQQGEDGLDPSPMAGAGMNVAAAMNQLNGMNPSSMLYQRATGAGPSGASQQTNAASSFMGSLNNMMFDQHNRASAADSLLAAAIANPQAYSFSSNNNGGNDGSSAAVEALFMHQQNTRRPSLGGMQQQQQWMTGGATNFDATGMTSTGGQRTALDNLLDGGLGLGGAMMQNAPHQLNLQQLQQQHHDFQMQQQINMLQQQLNQQQQQLQLSQQQHHHHHLQSQPQASLMAADSQSAFASAWQQPSSASQVVAKEPLHRQPILGHSALIAMQQQQQQQQGSSSSASLEDMDKALSSSNNGSGKRKEKKRRAKTFPEKLMSAFIELASNSEDAVAWLPDGKSFVIVDADRFVEDILCPAFKQCKYASFVRKLHRWGFVRLTSGTGTDCFHHPLFQKGRKDLAAKINCAPREKDGSLKGFPGMRDKPPSLAGVEKFIRAKAAMSASRAAAAKLQQKGPIGSEGEVAAAPATMSMAASAPTTAAKVEEEEEAPQQEATEERRDEHIASAVVATAI